MTQKFLIAVLGATTLISGCATKGYVRQNVTPLQDTLNQVSDQINKQGAELQKTQQEVATNSMGISATDEKVTTVDRRAGDALNRANEANQVAQQDEQEIAQLRGVIGNLDAYKMTNQTTVLFKLNSDVLSDVDKQMLDRVVSNMGSMKRYFVAVEGYTDTTGTPDYNLQLSKRRADAVVLYLSLQKSVPFYQIRTIGLGENELVDPGKTAAARAKNRRVEVKVFSADATFSAADGDR